METIVGQSFGRLTVLRRSEKISVGAILWDCACTCGNKTLVKGCNLMSGNTKSCGCLGTESRIRHNETAGGNRSPEYDCWIGIKTRCYDKNHSNFKNYGARGIKVCKRWLDSYSNFLSDMGRKPSSNYSIDRIDNDGNYAPSNCRWATRSEQNFNKRNNKKEKTICLKK